MRKWLQYLLRQVKHMNRGCSEKANVETYLNYDHKIALTLLPLEIISLRNLLNWLCFIQDVTNIHATRPCQYYLTIEPYNLEQNLFS